MVKENGGCSRYEGQHDPSSHCPRSLEILLSAILSTSVCSHWFLKERMLHSLQMTPANLVSTNMPKLASLAAIFHCQVYCSSFLAAFPMFLQSP